MAKRAARVKKSREFTDIKLHHPEGEGRVLLNVDVKWIVFARHYALGLNATEAAEMAKVCSPNVKRPSLRTQAHKMMKEESIIDMIDSFRYMLGRKLSITEEEFTKELLSLAKLNITDFMDSDGRYVNPVSLPTQITSALKSCKVSEDKEGKLSYDLQFHDKISAMRMLAELKDFGGINHGNVTVQTSGFRKKEKEAEAEEAVAEEGE